MRSNTVRDKRLRLNQNKLDRLKAVMGAASATEAIEQAMDFILAEDEIRKTLRRVGQRAGSRCPLDRVPAGQTAAD